MIHVHADKTPDGLFTRGYTAWVNLPAELGRTVVWHPTCPLRAFHLACEWALVRMGLREPWPIGGEA